MEALVKYLYDQWAVLVTAPAAFTAALALGAIIGWIAAWIILKQRLDHYKERIEYFKERAANTERTSVGDRSPVRARLQAFYIQMGILIDSKLAKDIPPEDFEKYRAGADEIVNNMANWIRENMGEAALARFTDRSGMSSVHYSNAANETHNRMIMNQTRFRQNLLAMIESSAWDKN
jgi:hypothetical protein